MAGWAVAEAGTSAKKVLIVDDDPDIINLVVCALEDEGYVAKGAVGDEAMAVAEAMRPDVILLDLMMPGVDGVTACRLLRDNPPTAAIPIVLLSAHSRLHGFAELLPVDDALAKPFELSALYAVVERWVGAAANRTHSWVSESAS